MRNISALQRSQSTRSAAGWTAEVVRTGTVDGDGGGPGRGIVARDESDIARLYGYG